MDFVAGSLVDSVRGSVEGFLADSVAISLVSPLASYGQFGSEVCKVYKDRDTCRSRENFENLENLSSNELLKLGNDS